MSKQLPELDVHDAERIASSRQCTNIQELLSRWPRERRASGGWWALAGFSFQSMHYLLRFFEGLQDGASGPVELAKTEILSDLFIPAAGRYTLIQVKRTLDRAQLRSALREAYQLAALCDEHLLSQLRFQIVCQKRATPNLPTDLPMEEVLESPGDEKVWRQLMTCFEQTEAIVEQSDPLDRLYDLLWHAGIHDVSGFVDSCLGILLRKFENPSVVQIDQIALDLNHEFQQARLNGSPADMRIGRLIRPDHVRPDINSDRDTKVLFDRRPQLRDLQLGRVRQRPAIFSHLVRQFADWWEAITVSNDFSRVPVYWIGGRSGEGKSVLLLQLAQHILLGKDPPLVTSLLSADALPDWVRVQSDIQLKMPRSNYLPSVVLVDDLHFIRDPEQWESNLAAAIGLYGPRVVVIACGPTPERANFEHDYSSLMSVASFDVPHFSLGEMEEFRDWYQQKTGESVQLRASELENRLLVVWMFELVQKQTLHEFARNFKRRLAAGELFDLAKTIVSSNMLELPAPLQIFEHLSDIARDRFLQLCSNSQLHFERVDASVETYGGYRLAHPQIAWRLYQEWTSPPTTVAQAFGRDLANSLVAATKYGDWPTASQLIHRAGSFSRFSESGEHNLSTELGTLDQTLQELYKKQRALSSSQEFLSTLHRWLALIFSRSTIRHSLDGDPLQEAIDRSADVPLQSELHPSLAGWLWRLGDLDENFDRRDRLRTAAKTILLGAPEKQGAGRALALIVGRSNDRNAATALCLDWLRNNSALEQAYHVLRVLIPTHAQNVDLYSAALNWATKHMSSKEAPSIIGALSHYLREDTRFIDLAIQWLAANPDHPNYCFMLGALLSARPQNSTLIDLALQWIKNNSEHRNMDAILGAVISAKAESDGLVDFALENIKATPAHKHNKSLTALISAKIEDSEIFDLALKWLEDNSEAKRSIGFLGMVVAAWPNDQRVIDVASRWLERNVNYPSVHSLLITLIVRTHGASEWMREGHLYFEGRKYGAAQSAQHKNEVLLGLLAGSNASSIYIEHTLDALDAETNPGKHNNLLIQMTRSLANNMSNSLAYLNSSAEPLKKRRVAKSLTYGFRKYPKRARDFLSRIDTAPPDFGGFLLSGCITSKLSEESLTQPLSKWLNSHRRQIGYGTVLHAIKQRPDRWSALLKHGDLRAEVISDYETLR